MERTTDLRADEAGLAFNASRPKSAASWGAIFAGALVAAGISLILLALGTGLGFASTSPWADHGVGVKTFTIAAAIWLILMQWVSSIFGGYIAGRLRTRWIGTHVHEIFFRDTAHGLVTWALATLMVAALAASSLMSGISGTVRATSTVVGESSSAALNYGIDKLFRSTGSAVPGAGGPTSVSATLSGASEPRMEVSRIMLNSIEGNVSDTDRSYLVSLVAARTGMTDADAQRRVDDFITAAKQAAEKVKEEADAARKDAAEVAMYTALSLLIGAFIASVSAALGGRLRDEHV